MKRSVRLMLTLFMLLCTWSTFAQNKDTRTIEGVVKNEKGQPLGGITVTEKGTKNATVSNDKGNFSLHLKNGNDAIIVFSGVGLETQEVKAGNQTVISIVLKDDAKALSDVVVVGYGTQKKVNLTGSVAVVKGSELINRPTATLSQALQGKVAGMNFTAGTYGFEPGAALGMQIRGQGSPLILVDGIQTDNINGVNPNDIESVSVLKDAASAAIYGAKASYGVILITTKSGGTNGRLSIEYSGNYSKIKPINMPHMLDSYTNALAMNEASANTGQSATYTNATIDRIIAYQKDPKNTPETVPSSANPALWANVFESNANYDWFNVYYGPGQRYQHNVSLSGGNNATSFVISGGYVNDGGVLKVGTDNYARYNVSAKFDAHLNDWIKVSSNTRYYNTSRTTPAYDNQGDYDLLFHQVARTMPNQYMKSPNGVYSIQSKIPWTRDAGNINTTINDIVQRFAAEVNLLKGWTVNGDYTFDITSAQGFSKNLTVYEDNVAGAPVLSASTSPASVAESQYINFYQTANLYSTYKFNIGTAHRFTAMAGYQHEKRKFSQLGASKNGLITGEVPSISTSTGTVNAADQIYNEALEGAFARLSYNYNDRYLVEFNGRYDGTYKFGPGKKWGFFPGVSAGWNVSNELFWENIKPVINNFKVRASWGSLGNQGKDRIEVPPYQDLSIINVNSNLPWIMNGVRPNYASAPTLINPDITWESSATKDLGVDLGVLQNRLNVTADIYQRNTFNQLGAQNALPAVIGAALPQVNNRETKTNGWELALNWSDKIGKDFRYSIGGQVSDYQTTITKFNNPTRILTSNYEGQKIGDIWGYTTVGLIQDQKIADGINTGKTQAAISGQTWRTGDVQYADLNGDGVVNKGNNTKDSSGDYRVIGNNTPRYQFGINLHAEWKGFDFTMFWQGVGQRDLWLDGNFFWGFAAANNQSSLFPGHLNYYRDADATTYVGLGKNTDAYFARPYFDGNMNAKNQQVQTRYLQNAAYARMKTIQLGYSVANALVQKVKLRGVYVYVAGENLITITKLPSHFDPENANIGPRGNGKSFFPQAAYTIGLNLKF